MNSHLNILYALDLLGTAAFAASGALAGVRKRMDLLGVVVLALITATGGGVMRDVLLHDTPPFCFKNENYLYLALLVSLIVFVAPRSFERLHKEMVFFDALGLGTFLVIGTSKAIEYGLGFMGSVIMGVMTATFGGLIRDVLSNEIPLILQREIYASACAVGGAALFVMDRSGVRSPVRLAVAALLVFGIRILAIEKGWQLPRGREGVGGSCGDVRLESHVVHLLLKLYPHFLTHCLLNHRGQLYDVICSRGAGIDQIIAMLFADHGVANPGAAQACLVNEPPCGNHAVPALNLPVPFEFPYHSFIIGFGVDEIRSDAFLILHEHHSFLQCLLHFLPYFIFSADREGKTCRHNHEASILLEHAAAIFEKAILPRMCRKFHRVRVQCENIGYYVTDDGAESAGISAHGSTQSSRYPRQTFNAGKTVFRSNVYDPRQFGSSLDGERSAFNADRIKLQFYHQPIESLIAYQYVGASAQEVIAKPSFFCVRQGSL